MVFDVTEHMTSWRRAIACYGSQFERTEQSVATAINAPGFVAAHEGRRARWGQRVSVDFAEGFLVEDPWLVAIGAEGKGDPS